MNTQSKIQRSKFETENSFKQQIQFIIDYCAQFDSGKKEYGSEIATKLRLLFHHTQNSISLLEQILRINNSSAIPMFMDTAICQRNIDELSNGNFVRSFLTYCAPLTNDKNITNELIPYPLLKKTPYIPTGCWKQFDEWWEGTTVLCAYHKNYSRKKVVLLLSNQDGGAHVDPEMNWFLAGLKRESIPSYKITINSIGQSTKYVAKSSDYLGACVRQIAFEALMTFEANPLTAVVLKK